MKIYLVQGTTGEYSDRKDWTVCAYRSKEKAYDHASKAMRRAMKLHYMGWKSYDNNGEVNEFDSKMQIDYTGTEYTTEEVELKS